MKRLLLTAAIVALASGRPESYKESEDFQYSRSSTDEGSKSGFYGAQRGNMGGNYERAHNMDTIAQNQMSGLVNQVDSEVGDGTSSRTGNAFAAGSSRGLYGSGRYDLNNLQGRNFADGVSYGNSGSHASSAEHSAHNKQSSLHSSAYTSNQAHNSRQQYENTGYHQNNAHSQALGYEAQNTAHGSHSGYQSNSGYDASQYNSNHDDYSNVKTRLVGASPARVVVRPGTTIVIPVSAQTYRTGQRSSAIHDENAINAEAEVLNNEGHHTNYRPSSNAKGYESSYRYRKQWEQHDTVPSVMPLSIPTPAENPIPRNSELYDGSDSQHVSNRQLSASNSHSSNYQNRHNSEYNTKAATSSQSRYQQSGYDSQQQSGSNSNAYNHGSNSNAYTHGNYNSGTAADNQVQDGDTNPKSYQSSYSYHKSWERQGDPYVIYPATNGNEDSSKSQNYRHSSHNYDSHSRKTHEGYTAGTEECDENGHRRVVRSADNDFDNQELQQLNNWDGSSDVTNQHLETFDQEPQNLGNFVEQRQTTHNQQNFGQYDKENLGQDTQDFGQFNQNLEYSRPETQYSRLNNFADENQQTQNLRFNGQELQDIRQQTQDLRQNHRNEDLTQQHQDNFYEEYQNLQNQQRLRKKHIHQQHAWDYKYKHKHTGKEEILPPYQRWYTARLGDNFKSIKHSKTKSNTFGSPPNVYVNKYKLSEYVNKMLLSINKDNTKCGCSKTDKRCNNTSPDIITDDELLL